MAVNSESAVDLDDKGLCRIFGDGSFLALFDALKRLVESFFVDLCLFLSIDLSLDIGCEFLDVVSTDFTSLLLVVLVPALIEVVFDLSQKLLLAEHLDLG